LPQIKGNRLVLLNWLSGRMSASKVVRCSAAKIGDEFGWSKQYTFRMLGRLEDDGFIATIDLGTGKRSNKWKILRPEHSQGAASRTKKQKGATTDEKEVNKHVPVGNLFTISKNKNPENSSKRKSPVYNVRAAFTSTSHTRKRVTTDANPFIRFKQVWDDADVWSAPDLVCYFSYLYSFRFGEKPDLNWPREVGSAKTILKRCKKGHVAKVFLQVAFVIAKFKPKSLASFTYTDFFDSVIEQDVTPALIDDYEDDSIFPWLREERKRVADQASTEYLKELMKSNERNRPRWDEESRRRKNKIQLRIEDRYRYRTGLVSSY
jgi:hypothetical protein